MDLRKDARTSRAYSIQHGISPKRGVAERILATLGPGEQAVHISAGTASGFRVGALVVTELRVLLVPPPGRGDVDVLARRDTSGALATEGVLTAVALRSDTDTSVRLLHLVPTAAEPSLRAALPRLERLATADDVRRWAARPIGSAPPGAVPRVRPAGAPPRPSRPPAAPTSPGMRATSSPSAPVSLSGGPPAHTWKEAEGLASVAMVYLGFPDARLTAEGKDDGVDVVATGAVAQVKFWQNAARAPDVRDLFGTATAAGARALFFSHNGYTADAKAFGERAGVCMFTFSTDGTVVAASSAARTLLIDAIGRMADPAEQRRLQAERSAFEATERELERLAVLARSLTDVAKRTARTVRNRSQQKKHQSAVAHIQAALTGLGRLDHESSQSRRERLVRDASGSLRRAAKDLDVTTR